MEVEYHTSEEESRESMEEDSWDVSQGDPNDYFWPVKTEEILAIQDISNLTSEMIKEKIINYWNTPKVREREKQMQKDDILKKLSKRIIGGNFIQNPDGIDIPKDEYMYKNVINENDYSPQDKAQQEEAERLAELEKDSMIIHIDVRRAFDNISPKMLNSFVNKMAESKDFKILKPFKNLIKRWMTTSGSERIRIEGYQEFRRHYGGPQGSLWTPAIWNLYLTTILMNSPLKKMIRLYADNVFIWIAPDHINQKYIKKLLRIIKNVLKLGNLEINEDEIYVFWRGKKPKYKEVISSIIQISEEQRILGYWFKLSQQAEWIFQIKFWIPMSPRRSLINISFKDRIMAFKAKALGSLYYQIQGWFLFGDSKDKFDWPNLNRNIRNAFIYWTGLTKISYMDLASLGILLRPYLIDKLTEAYCEEFRCNYSFYYKEVAETFKSAYLNVRDLLNIKYLPEVDDVSKINDRFRKMGNNFVSQIAKDKNKVWEWLEGLINQMNEDLMFKDPDKKYNDFYLTKLDPKAKSWEKILNYQRKFSLIRRYKDDLLINHDNKIRWRNRAFWHLCLQKEMNRKEGTLFLEKLRSSIRNDLTWTKVIMDAMQIEEEPNIMSEKIKDFLSERDWIILDDICQIVDSFISGDKNWLRQQLVYICHKYAKEVDRQYIDYLQQKCQMLKCKDK
jgi:hypothetical protein